MITVRSWDRNDGRVHLATLTLDDTLYIWCEQEHDVRLAWNTCPVGTVPTCFYCIVNT